MNAQELFNKSFPEPNTGCWLWGGAVDKDGYGKIYHKTNQNFRRAHRYSFFLHKGQNPAGQCVLHSCDTPLCINPDHLFLGTNQENTADRHSKNRNAKGSNHGMSKLTEAQVLEILTLYATNKFGRCKLQRLFNVSSHAIYGIIAGKTWLHVPFDRNKIKSVHSYRKSNWKSNHSLR